MQLLDFRQLELPDDMRADPDVMRYVQLHDRTLRAEKVSDPAAWAHAETEAYASGDWVKFSRLRGYTEAEIHDFQQYVDLSNNLLEKYSEDDVAWIGYTVQEQTGVLGLTLQQILSRECGD